MKALTALAALSLLAAALAVLPSAQALDAPPQCVLAPCCGGPCPPPCYDCPPPGPCPERVAGTPQQVPILGLGLGPHATVRTSTDCTADLDQTGTPCTSLADPEMDTLTAGGVTLSYTSCRVNPDCTCDPLPIEVR